VAEGDHNAGGAVERVTIAEAAALLDCHPNTVRNRVKAGMYRAEKVHTENGPTWMIERDSLIDNTPTSARQQAVSGVPAAQEAAIQELARAIVREAGLQRDPEVKYRRENMRACLDSLKHTSTLAGATVVAVLLLQQTLALEVGLVVVTLAVVGLSFLLSLLGASGVSLWMALRDHQLSEYSPRKYWWVANICSILLFVGVFMFGATALLSQT